MRERLSNVKTSSTAFRRYHRQHGAHPDLDSGDPATTGHAQAIFRLASRKEGCYRQSVADPLPPNLIFMCYRRDDSADVAGRIYDRLVAEFGKEAIYRDVDTIPFGEDFREHIRGCLSTCRVGLVVIGPEWCTIAGRSGRPRLHESADHVRLEVEAMLARGAMKTIPLYVRGAESPAPEALPEVLQPLAFRNGADIRRDPDFHHDMDRVLVQLRHYLVSAAEKVAPPAAVVPEKVAAPITPPAPEVSAARTPMAAPDVGRVSSRAGGLPMAGGDTGPTPAPPELAPPEPAPVAREEAPAAAEPVAASALPPAHGSAGPGRWRKFVAWLPGARTWGWIWVGLSGIEGLIFTFHGTSVSAAMGAPLLLAALLSPVAVLAHWRDGRRGAAICAVLYFPAAFVASACLEVSNEPLGVGQLIYAVAWAAWGVFAWGKRGSGGAEASRVVPPGEAGGWGRSWRTLHPAEWAVLALAAALPALWLFGPFRWFEDLFDRDPNCLPLVVGSALAVWAMVVRRWDAAVIALFVALEQRSVFYIVSTLMNFDASAHSGSETWSATRSATWSAVVSAAGAIIVWRAPSGAGLWLRAWWRESVDAVGRTPEAVGWIAVLLVLALPWVQGGTGMGFYVAEFGPWLVTALLAALPARFGLWWTVRFLACVQAAINVLNELAAFNRMPESIWNPTFRAVGAALAVFGAVLLVLGRLRARAGGGSANKKDRSGPVTPY